MDGLGAGRRALVIGAGLIGSAMARRLADEGFGTTVLTRSRVESPLEGCHYHVLSKPGLADLRELLQDGDIVVAAYGPARPRAPQTEARRLFSSITETAYELFDVVNSHSGIRLIWFSSGGTVYGPEAVHPTEETILRPAVPYGVAKAAEELVLGLVNRGSNHATALRCSTVYGRRAGGPTTQGLVDVAIDRVSRDEPVTLFGGGQARRGYIHVDDLAAVALSIACANERSPVYNVCSGEIMSALQVIESVGMALGRAPQTTTLPGSIDRHVTIDNSRLLADFPSVTFRTLKAGIKDLLSASHEPAPVSSQRSAPQPRTAHSEG